MSRNFNAPSHQTRAITYRKSKPLSTQIHTRHVQIRTEEGNLPILVPVCFKPFKGALGIMEHG